MSGKKTEWVERPDEPRCPNNTRHGELVPHEKGGYVCRDCESAHTKRSRVAYRFSVPR